MSNDTDIQLCAAFKAVDSAGTSHDIKGMRIFDEGYGIIDVYVDFVAAIENTLCKDKILISNLMTKLRGLGYVGPDCIPGDPALQERKLIVLEAPEEFCAFAQKFGWKNLAEEFDDE